MVRRELGLDPVFVHTSYLINVASMNPEVRERSAALLAEEMERADAIGADYVVLHPGSARDRKGWPRSAAAIRMVLGGRRFRAGLLLENTAGRRGDIAPGPEELGRLMDAAGGLPAGLCLDTCHAFAAGYRLGEAREIERLGGEIERHVGTGAVRLVHLNDSRTPAGSRRDRHEHLGRGEIGLPALRRFLHHPSFAALPVVLETPVDDAGDDIRNLRTARRLLAHP
jgi:deoxyribonuclease-4